VCSLAQQKLLLGPQLPLPLLPLPLPLPLWRLQWGAAAQKKRTRH
jgi:hypothetical protein